MDSDLKLRKELGVTIHKNMSPKIMAEQWSKVSDIVKAKYPALNALFTPITTAQRVVDSAIEVKDTLSQVYTTQKEVLESASAALYAPQLPAAKLAEEAQVVVVAQGEQSLDQAKTTAFNALTQAVLG